MMTSRTFEESKGTDQTRLFRCHRRRIQRASQRVEQLKECVLRVASDKYNECFKVEDKEAQEIIAKIEAKSFMPKQVMKDNGVIPYQVPPWLVKTNNAQQIE